MVENARPELQEEIEQHIVYGQYYSPQAVMADINAMTDGLIGVTVNYYYPLKIQISDEEYGDWYEVDNSYGITNEDAIRELLKKEQDSDMNNMPYNYRIVRQIIECVVVKSKEEIKVIFIGEAETVQNLEY